MKWSSARSVSAVCTGVAVIILAGLTGCQSTTSDTEACKVAVPGAAPEAGMLNASCVMMPDEDARGSGVAVAYTGKVESWKGKKVAFCCDGCVNKWEKLTDAQRDEALVKVAAK